MQRIDHHMFAAADRQNSILKSRLSLTSLIGIFLDPVVIILTLAAVTYAIDEPFEAPYVILSLIVFSLTFPGKSLLNVGYGVMYRDITFGWLMLAAVLFFFGYASGYIKVFPEEIAWAWFIATPIALLAAHHAARIVIPRVLSMRANYRTAVIVGANEQGLELARKIEDNPYIGIRFLGFFDDRSRERLGDLGAHPLLGSMKTLAEYVRMHQIDNIYLSLPMVTQPRILHLLDDMRDTTASIYFLPDLFVTDLIQARMDDVSGMPVVAVCETPFTGINGLIKRTSDLLLAAIILVLITPLMLAIAIGVKLSSPGPVIFKQRRYGLDGKQISVYKFRTMTVCEDGPDVPQATKDDKRITRFGAFLRRTSLDEVPQFFNVLQGRMSIVGPRPHAVAHNETYRKLIKGYMIRHKVKPGITGLAQVSGFRGETETLDKMKGRIDQDLAYLRNWSLRLDLQIILKTVAVVLSGDRNAY
jgi:putative colanic acid biosynthesis UDP-glucose lipid carrier transferase